MNSCASVGIHVLMRMQSPVVHRKVPILVNQTTIVSKAKHVITDCVMIRVCWTTYAHLLPDANRSNIDQCVHVQMDMKEIQLKCVRQLHHVRNNSITY